MKRSPLLFALLASVASAATWGAVSIVYKYTGSAVALSGPLPTATSGHPLNSWLARDAGLRLPESWVPAKVWCELETMGTGLTGGTLRWWKQSEQADGGWGAALALDQTIGTTTGARWISTPLDVVGADGRIYCQPVSVTETGTGADGGLRVVYGFRLERP